jgi:general nucleoside transport system permease protein
MEVGLAAAFITTILASTWRLATPLIYASLGEVFSERAGVLNIGLEGIMLFGAFTGFAVASFSGSRDLGLLAGVLVGILVGLLFGFFVITIKANQIVVGAALNMFGLGMTGFLYRALFTTTVQGISAYPPINIPGLSQIPMLGEILFQHNLLVYATVGVVIVAGFVLNRTAFGLSVRAIGEHPKAADTAGINVFIIRYTCCMIGGALAALGGAYLTIAHTNQFVENITSGRGFIALAVVVFGRWKPWGAFGASLLFGVFYTLQLQMQARTNTIMPYQVWQALPYVATLLVLVSLRGRSAAPKALGEPYEAA